VEYLIINGSMSTSPMEIKEHIVHFYSNLYYEQFTWRPRVDGLLFHPIDADESIWLERDFEEQEVWEW
jgi:hypothetical protein